LVVILDSSVLVAKERGRFALDQFLTTHPDEVFLLSAVTVSELWHGVERAAPPQRKTQREQTVMEWLADFGILNFDAAVARTHARIWAELEVRGTLIGPHDIQIAATAIHHGHELATLNQKEFMRISGLRLADVAPFQRSTPSPP
jgi:predicted nucleic acid-binding protein